MYIFANGKAYLCIVGNGLMSFSFCFYLVDLEVNQKPEYWPMYLIQKSSKKCCNVNNYGNLLTSHRTDGGNKGFLPFSRIGAIRMMTTGVTKRIVQKWTRSRIRTRRDLDTNVSVQHIITWKLTLQNKLLLL